jgi:hypothetical protein
MSNDTRPAEARRNVSSDVGDYCAHLGWAPKTASNTQKARTLAPDDQCAGCSVACSTR